MDRQTQPEQVYLLPIYNVPGADASTRTTVEGFIPDESCGEAITQTTDEDLILLETTRETGTQAIGENREIFVEIHSKGNASTATLDGWADASEAMFVKSHNNDNIYGTVNPQGFQISSSLEAKTDFGKSSESGEHPEPYDEVKVHNMKRSITNYRMGFNNQSSKRSRSEIFAESRKDTITESEEYNKHYDKALEINTPSHISFEYRHLAGFNQEIQSTKEYLTHNPEVQIFSNLGKKTLLNIGQNTSSNINVESSCTASENSEINYEESQSYNQGMQALGLSYKNRPVIVQNVGLQSSENSNAIAIITDSGVSSREIVYSMDDILAIPGPSRLSREENVQNLCVAKLQSSNPSETLPVLLQNKVFICRICDRSNEHVMEHEGKKYYHCCICGFKTKSGANLQMHNDIHCPQKRCSICEIEYAEGNMHESERKCIVCKKAFSCKILLDHHSVVEHENYFETHCWVCNKDIREHCTEHEGRMFYTCCVCENLPNSSNNIFTYHNSQHLPNLFCEICKEQYPSEEKSLHNSGYKCNVCEEMFKCITQLEDHTKDHKKYFGTKCILCCGEIKGVQNKHEIVEEGHVSYKCCKCNKTFHFKSWLLKHLYTHIYLRLFKCDVCGKRLNKKGQHNKICPPLPSKCEKCGARFPSIQFLNKHVIKEHRHT